MCPSTFAPNMCDSVYSGGGGVCLCVCANGSTLTTCSCHHPLRFPSLLPHVAPGNRGRGGGGGGVDSDHLSVAWRSMELEGRGGGRG